MFVNIFKNNNKKFLSRKHLRSSIKINSNVIYSCVSFCSGLRESLAAALDAFFIIYLKCMPLLIFSLNHWNFVVLCSCGIVVLVVHNALSNKQRNEQTNKCKRDREKVLKILNVTSKSIFILSPPMGFTAK